jgi:hypothetical protein
MVLSYDDRNTFVMHAHPGVLLYLIKCYIVGYFGVKSTKVYRVQMVDVTVICL